MDVTRLGKREAAVAYLRRSRAAEVPHLTTDLLTHLLGTEAILQQWDAAVDVRLAGLCHATYGTDGFPQSLTGLDARAGLAAAIGADAEALVYLYASCDRSTVYPRLDETTVQFRDRFTDNEFAATDRQMTGFALITVANELDLVRRGALGDELREPIADLFDHLARWAGPPAVAAAADVRHLDAALSDLAACPDPTTRMLLHNTTRWLGASSGQRP
jgi:hypothetical protein